MTSPSRLYTEKEIKEMHEYMEKVTTPIVKKFLDENGYDESSMTDLNNPTVCLYCGHEIDLSITYATFQPVKCDHCGTVNAPCSICRDLTESYDFCWGGCPIGFMENKIKERREKSNNMSDIRLLTDEEIKEMREYMDKMIKPDFVKFLDENNISSEELKETGKMDECPHCENEIELDVSFETFRPIKCSECGEIISPCGICRDFGEAPCEKCPIDWIINKKSLQTKLEAVCKKIEIYEPEPYTEENKKMFDDEIDRLWKEQHGSKIIEIANSSFFPSDVIKKLDSLGYHKSCEIFAKEMEKENYINIPSYKELIEEKESIENELKTLLNVPGLLASPAPEKTKKSGLVDAILEGKDK